MYRLMRLSKRRMCIVWVPPIASHDILIRSKPFKNPNDAAKVLSLWKNVDIKSYTEEDKKLSEEYELSENDGGFYSDHNP